MTSVWLAFRMPVKGPAAVRAIGHILRTLQVLGWLLVPLAILVTFAGFAMRAWAEGRPGSLRHVRIAAVVLAALGATFWWPALTSEFPTPLDFYLMWARVVLLAAGIGMLALAASPAAKAHAE